MDVYTLLVRNFSVLLFGEPSTRFILSADWTLFCFRLVIGVIFLIHGIQKLHYWKIKHVGTIPKRYLFLFRIVSFLEIVGACSLFLGVFVHIMTLFLIAVMIGALYFKIVVWRKGFTGESGWELDLLMIAALCVLFFLGSGFFSFDRILRQ